MAKRYVMAREDAMKDTNEWLDALVRKGRKEATIRTYRNNVRQCIKVLDGAGRPCSAADMSEDDIMFLWTSLTVKEEVKRAYLRNFSQMVCYHTGRNILKNANILYNRECRYRTHIDDSKFKAAYLHADERERLILCLGAFMGLRRLEMCKIRDSDLNGGVLTVHGKGHGAEGLVARMDVPEPVAEAIAAYRRSELKHGMRLDDYLLQSRDHRGRLHYLDPSRVSDLMHDLGKECGFQLTTHSLRRYFATTLYYKTNTDLQTLKNMLRHADVSTTLKCYVDCSEVKSGEAQKALASYLEDLTAEGKEL